MYSIRDVAEIPPFSQHSCRLPRHVAQHLCVQLGLCVHRGCATLVNDAVGLVAQLPEASCWHFVMCGLTPMSVHVDAQHSTAFAFSGRVVTAHHCDIMSPLLGVNGMAPP